MTTIPQSKQSRLANGNYPLPGGLWLGQALMELDCWPFHMQLSHHAPVPVMRPKPTNCRIHDPKPRSAHRLGMQLAPHWGREQMHLSRHWSKSMCSHCDLDDTMTDPAFTTLLCMS